MSRPPRYLEINPVTVANLHAFVQGAVEHRYKSVYMNPLTLDLLAAAKLKPEEIELMKEYGGFIALPCVWVSWDESLPLNGLLALDEWPDMPMWEET